ncbi:MULTISPECIES: non-ribosomal peptide synthetase [Lysobacter]|uniref:non-ribosomal peptide synthetase n=1 Tax=Lysobacter TaxID=68 RepID=UPI001F39E622|nr:MULTISPECIES: non-ribosomal peptide synthetase [Lysobacter]UJB20528.1 amino acid adenylation domain-containing protein [Lysobacter capsici]UJQ30358.1 amino acid adenylation domain-containing protein [Lysobacter gummosus]
MNLEARAELWLPLSAAQRGRWLTYRMAPARQSDHNNVFSARVRGHFSSDALQRALRHLAIRHPMLRVRIRERDGIAEQRFCDTAEVELRCADASGWDEGELARQVERDGIRPFRLDSEPPFRAGLYTRGPNEQVLMLAFDHIAVDGWSYWLVLEELGALLSDANIFDPAAPVHDYGQYVRWQEQWLRGDEAVAQRNYWRQTIADEGTLLQLPTDRASADSDQGTQVVSVSVPAGLSDAVSGLARRHASTLYTCLLAAYQMFLHRITGQDEIAVGSPMPGRSLAQWDRVVGDFVNPVVIKASFTAEKRVAQVLRETRNSALKAVRYQDYPYQCVVEDLRARRGGAEISLFQTMFVFQHARHGAGLRGLWSEQGADEGIAWGGAALSAYPVGRSGGESLPLVLEAIELEQGLRCDFRFDPALFDRATVERLAGCWLRLLESLTADDCQRVAELDLLDQAQRHQLLHDFNATQAPLPAEPLAHRAFEAQAAALAQQPALVSGDRTISYAELNRDANRIAHRLIAAGVGVGDRVGIFLERGPSLIAALLGTLKAGAAYVPMDPAYPPERLSHMLHDSAPRRVLSTLSLRDRLPDQNATNVLWLDDDGIAADGDDRNPHPIGLSGNDAAYLIYTSGSTGKPKGVVVEHLSLTAQMATHVRNCGLGPGERMLQFASYSFDSSVVEIFPALSAGATVMLRPDDLIAPDADFVGFLRRHDVGIVDVPTAFWHRWAMQLRDGAVEQAPSLRLVVVGGEKVERRFLDAWLTATPCPVLNTYGPTETTVYATAVRLDRTTARLDREVPIGGPVANTRIYVLDARGEPVPVGVAGELFIAGVQIARGYWNRPELTAERFVRDPFSADPRARMYKTGDLGRWLADGTIEFLGRNDFQVKIRGFRIELGEIEARLAACDGVREAVVIAREDVEGDKRLVAYAVMDAGAELSVASLRESLSKDLAEYMIPSAFVAMESLPLTPNGKLDRKALPAPDQGAVLSREHEAPLGEIESAIAAVWQDLLGLERVGRHDHFFELGGHSLLAAQVASRLRHSLGLDIPLRELFSRPTPAMLAAGLLGAQSASQPPIALADRNAALPLSWAQQRLWFLDQLDHSAGAAYHMPVALRLSGELDRLALQKSLDRIISRHENLRTRFVSQSGAPVQVIDSADTGFVLVGQDLSDLAADAKAAAVATQSREEAHAPFDLAQGPLIRGRLLRVSEDEHVLLVTQHHIVSDGWSIGVLVKEVSALYDAFRQGRPDPLPPLPIQYADYAAWQRGWLQGDTLQRQTTYWREQLRGAPAVLELPTDRPRPAVQSYAGDRVPVRLSSELSAQLRGLSQRHGTTVFMTLLTGWSILLSRLSGQSEVVVGSPVANRQRSELEPLIGFFVNTLALRVDLQDAPSVSDLLSRVKATTLAAYEHQDLPFEQVVEAAQPVRSMSHSPLFQALLSLNNTPDGGGLQLHGLSLSQLESGQQTTHFDLELSLEDNGDEIFGELSYSTELFDRSTIERYVASLTVLLQHLAQESSTVDALPWLPVGERERVVEAFNATAAPRRIELIHRAFEAQVRATPEAVALEFDGARLSYSELNRRANRLAHRLMGLGVKPDVRVAICVERSLEMVIALLGTLKAGGAYVPLDPSYPRDRLAYVLEDSAPAAVLVHSATRELLPEDVASPRIALDADALLGEQNEHDPEPEALGLTPRHLAYVIYTSGSTGQPKGVMNEHHAVMNRLDWGVRQFPWNASDRVLQKTPFGFDVSVWEFFQPLLSGATLVLAKPLGHQDPDYLVDLIESAGITVAHFVPSMLQVFVDRVDAGRCKGLKQLFCSGEALPYSLQQQVFVALPGVELHNLYGPTEAAIEVTYWNCAEPSQRRAVPIGRPVANTQMYVLDARGEPVPVGVAGELFIAGVQVARGYWNRPELTAERFVRDPFSADPQARMYKTGDLGRWLADGTIEYLGRNDFQVKIRGFRIELGEIEARLVACDGVREAVVIAREDVEGDKRLVAYAVMEPGVELSVAALRESLSKDLAEYMVPSAFVALEALPLTPNGKLDRKALPAPDQAAVLSREYEAPQGEIETAIAEIWQDLLGIERVGRHDHFFELGGHSLLAVQVASRLRQQLDVDIPLADLFKSPQLIALARTVLVASVERYSQEDVAMHSDELDGLSEEELRALLEEEDG